MCGTRIARLFLVPGMSPSRTRPLCPYPSWASYKGTGEVNDAANFVCKT